MQENGSVMNEDILSSLKASIVNMEEERAAELTRAALAELSGEEILNGALVPAMEAVGREYEEGLKFIPEMLLASRAMSAALEVLKPVLARSGARKVGKVVIGTVEGDVHDIGQRMVGIMLEGAGFEVWSLGSDVSAAQFVGSVREKEPDLLGMSALLTTTAPRMKDVIAALRAEGLRDRVKVMVGGAVLNQRLSEEYGADGYAPDGASAVRLAKKLMGLQ